MKRGTLICVVLAAVVVAALVLYRGQGNQKATVARPVDRDEKDAVDDRQNERNEDPAAKPREGKRSASTSPGKRWARRLKSAEARRELLRLIERARTTRRTTRQNTTGQSVQQDDAPQGRLDKKYIKSVINEAAPLVQECYELALRDNPDLRARLVLEFTITGEPEVGGIVEQVQIPTDGGPAQHGTLPECLKETVLSLEFPEPQDGGKVVVRYPFSFRPK